MWLLSCLKYRVLYKTSKITVMESTVTRFESTLLSKNIQPADITKNYTGLPRKHIRICTFYCSCFLSGNKR